MSATFSVMVKQFEKNCGINTIPNPSRPGYLCIPDDFLLDLIQFISMMQVMKVGVGSEIDTIKKNLKIANQFLKEAKTQDKLYTITVNAINDIVNICSEEGEDAYTAGKMKLAETFAWTIAGCRLYLSYLVQK
ncbi:hypothetical protein ACWGOQ_0020740 [Aquimarina sp. M1]